MENKWGMHIKTSISEKIAYGMGDVACNVVYALTSGDCEKKSVNKILL